MSTEWQAIVGSNSPTGMVYGIVVTEMLAHIGRLDPGDGLRGDPVDVTRRIVDRVIQAMEALVEQREAAELRVFALELKISNVIDHLCDDGETEQEDDDDWGK